MSDQADPVVVKVIRAVRDAQSTPGATAAIAKTLTDITKLNQTDRGKYLAAFKAIVSDDAVKDTDDVAYELAQAAAALAVARKGREVTPVAA
jgi:hypothetical protein